MIVAAVCVRVCVCGAGHHHATLCRIDRVMTLRILRRQKKGRSICIDPAMLPNLASLSELRDGLFCSSQATAPPQARQTSFRQVEPLPMKQTPTRQGRNAYLNQTRSSTATNKPGSSQEPASRPDEIERERLEQVIQESAGTR